MTKPEARLHRLFERIGKKFPVAKRSLDWLRQPSTRLVRIPLAVLLVLGGVFSILPGLGIWMLPVGLLLLAVDIHLLQTPITYALIHVQRKWTNWRRSHRKA